MRRLAFIWWLLGILAAIRDFFLGFSPKYRKRKHEEKEREEDDDIYGTE